MKRYIRSATSTHRNWDTVIQSLEIEAADLGFGIEVTSESGDPQNGGEITFNLLSSDGVIDECGISVRDGNERTYGRVYVIWHKKQSASVVSVDRAVKWLGEYFENFVN